MSLSRFGRHRSLPPWEVVDLIANKLDPKSLGIASCVSKSWSSSMSADHIWQPLCAAHFPSISNLHPALPYRRIYALGHSSAQRRLQTPQKPRLSLDDLLLAITLPCTKSLTTTIVKACDELEKDPDGVFRFDFNLKDEDFGGLIMDDDEDVKITCNILLKGYEGVFTVLDGKGKGRTERWFTEELPSPGCCFSGGTSGLVAEINIVVHCEIGEIGEKVVGKVNVGIMNVSSWRYASVDDALRYLQHFLLPSHASEY